MSYTTTLKEYLCEIKDKSKCCRKAFLYGVYISALDKNAIKLPSEAACNSVATLLEEELSLSASKKLTAKTAKLVFDDVTLLEKQFGTTDESLALGIIKCDACLNAFSRGVFVGCGHMNDPKGEHHLELVIGGVVADELLEVLDGEGVTLSKTCRKGKELLYCKSGDAIQDFLTYIGAVKFSLDMMKERVTKEMRLYASRVRNFDFANINKATMAAGTTVEAIHLLEQTGVLSSLSPELIETAKLRLEFPDATLEELRKKIEPPISKSGLNHRLKRLESEAKAIAEKNTNQ